MGPTQGMVQKLRLILNAWPDSEKAQNLFLTDTQEGSQQSNKQEQLLNLVYKQSLRLTLGLDLRLRKWKDQEWNQGLRLVLMTVRTNPSSLLFTIHI